MGGGGGVSQNIVENVDTKAFAVTLKQFSYLQFDEKSIVIKQLALLTRVMKYTVLFTLNIHPQKIRILTSGPLLLSAPSSLLSRTLHARLYEDYSSVFEKVSTKPNPSIHTFSAIFSTIILTRSPFNRAQFSRRDSDKFDKNTNLRPKYCTKIRLHFLAALCQFICIFVAKVISAP